MCTAVTATSPSVMGSALFGATTFCAKQHGPDECDAKGLPLTLHSINVIGKFQRLKAIYHPNLCLYLDARKLKTERLVIVSEWYNDCLENHIKSTKFTSTSSLALIAKQVLSALSLLEEKGLTHRSLGSHNILVTPEGDVKLFNYGLYYVTGNGKAVDFPVGSPCYMAPEVVVAEADTASSPKVDVWSLGIVLLELFMETPIYPDLFLKNALATLFKRLVLLSQNFQRKSSHPLDALLESHGLMNKEMNEDLRSFLLEALNPIPSQRSSASALLSHCFIVNHARPHGGLQNSQSGGTPYPILPNPFQSILRCSSLPIQPSQGNEASLAGKTASLSENIRQRPLQEVYYLWSLAGGDLELEMKKVGLIPTKPPIFNVPSLVTNKGVPYGISKDRITLYDGTVVQLPLDQLEKRLELMTTADFYPLLEYKDDQSGPLDSPSNSVIQDTAKLPLAIKENDVEYQFHRVIMYSRLLESYPHSQPLIQMQASTDVCPLRRGEIWAALLGVKGDLLWQYVNIDKDSWTATDRQIEVDIPRCHQYDTLLSSSCGHQKFKRILKAWVVTHPDLVYWQGLDSLCAPFLALNFNNEELAYASLSAFIDHFLHKFFLKDNSAIMQEYLAVFSQLIAFHDPELYNHLDSSGFFPELYAIPWFLTMFTHILPLDKIYHLWDTMLLGNSSFPLFVGLSILQQLRSDLLSLAFNECILLFSDMPVVDIQSCIQTAVRLFQSTPVSVYMREHQVGPIHSESIPIEADRQPLSVQVLKSESSPQISAHDLIGLCRLEPQTQLYGRVSKSNPQHGGNEGGANNIGNKSHKTGGMVMDGSLLLNKTPTKSAKKLRKPLVIDIRPNEEFRLGHVPNSINIPHGSAFSPDGSLNSTAATSTLTTHRGRTMVVVGNKGESGPIFARQLVRLTYPKVCVLYGGAGVLRTLGVLTSLQDDI